MNNKPPILQVLMSLFSELPYLGSGVVKLTSSQEIFYELQKLGLNHQAVEQALSWIERFGKISHESKADYHPKTVRVFTPEELAVIPSESLRFLVEAYSMGDICSYELEFIIEQIMLLGTHMVTDEQFLWVFEMTIANQDSRVFNDSTLIDNTLLMSFRFH